MAELDENGEAVVKITGISVGLGILSVNAVDENGDEISEVTYTFGDPVDSCATFDDQTQTLGIVSLPCDTEMAVTCEDSGENPIAGYLIASIDPSTAVTVEMTPVTDTSGEAKVLVEATAEGQATVSASVTCGTAADTATVNLSECVDDSDCDDSNECTSNSCVSGSCSYTPVTNGTSCDDGLYCNGSDDSCVDGSCDDAFGEDPCLFCSSYGCYCDDNLDYCVGCDADDDCDGRCNPGESNQYCDGSDNCPDIPNPEQEDTMPSGSGNSCGDACECEGDFEPDGDVDGTDAIAFKTDFFRKDCSTNPPCNGDFECDGDVDGSDAVMFKVDFFRKDCPDCSGWPCVYE